jgi:hypothetical protein
LASKRLYSSAAAMRAQLLPALDVDPVLRDGRPQLVEPGRCQGAKGPAVTAFLRGQDRERLDDLADELRWLRDGWRAVHSRVEQPDAAALVDVVVLGALPRAAVVPLDGPVDEPEPRPVDLDALPMHRLVSRDSIGFTWRCCPATF